MSEGGNVVKSVSRALQIIDIISAHKGGLGVTDISKQIDINKSSVYRILATMVQHGYVEQDPNTGKYKLGYKFLEISTKLLDSIDLRGEAQPYLQELEKYTNEVIHLVVYDQGEVVYIEKLDGNETLRMHSMVGKRAPMHCTAVGKSILAHLPENEALEIIDRKGLSPHTEYTITEKEAFLEELKSVREKGYALDLQENEYGITCIGAPIFDHTGKAVSAISISGPTMRMTEERLEELKDKVLEVGKKISARLGYRER